MVEFCQRRSNIACTTRLQSSMLFNDQIEADAWIAHGIAAQQLYDMPSLSTRTAHEFQAGRYVIKQVSHRYSGTVQARSPSTLRHLTITQSHEGSRMLFAHCFC